MADYQVTCIIPDGADADRRIDRLGGFGWQDTIDNVIGFILAGTHRFYTSVAGRSVWVVVKQHPTSGRNYLTTEGDGFPPNNLLAPHRRPAARPSEELAGPRTAPRVQKDRGKRQDAPRCGIARLGRDPFSFLRY